MTLSTSAVAACCSRASISSRVRRAISASCPLSEELPPATGAVRRSDTSALRPRVLSGSPPALERRRIAHPKGSGLRFQSGITAGICDWRNGVQYKFALQEILNGPCRLSVLAALQFRARAGFAGDGCCGAWGFRALRVSAPRAIVMAANGDCALTW